MSESCITEVTGITGITDRFMRTVTAFAARHLIPECVHTLIAEMAVARWEAQRIKEARREAAVRAAHVTAIGVMTAKACVTERVGIEEGRAA